MRKEFSMEKFLNKLKSDKFIISLGMPMGYMPGLPVIRRINDQTCLTIPFFKRKISKKVLKGEDRKFEVAETYPIQYSVTYALRAINLPDFVTDKDAGVLAGNEKFLEKTITEGKPIAFEDLSYNPNYVVPKKDNSGTVPIDSNRPIGIFNVGKTEYNEKLQEIYKLYDEAINTRLYEEKIDGALENRLINKLNELLEYEKTLKPFYEMLDSELYGKRIASTDK